MRILISNDDGFFTEGIKELAKAMRKLGEVWVVAPDRERSATGHALTLHKPLRVKSTNKAENEYYINGSPTDCVNLAVNQLMPQKPDIVVSGINRGANLGDDVTYSGTVAACLEASLLGLPAIAFSAIPNTDDECHYEAAADFAKFIVPETMKHGLPPGTILNVNIPSEIGVGDHKCVVTRLGKRIYSDIIEEKIDPRGRPYYWVGGPKVGSHIEEGTDCEAAEQRKTSVTPITLDFTNHMFLPDLLKWQLPKA